MDVRIYIRLLYTRMRPRAIHRDGRLPQAMPPACPGLEAAPNRAAPHAGRRVTPAAAPLTKGGASPILVSSPSRKART